jgi:hypothetical protein
MRLKRLWQIPLERLKRWYLSRVLKHIGKDMDVYSFPRGSQMVRDTEELLLQRNQGE